MFWRLVFNIVETKNEKDYEKYIRILMAIQVIASLYI